MTRIDDFVHIKIRLNDTISYLQQELWSGHHKLKDRAEIQQTIYSLIVFRDYLSDRAEEEITKNLKNKLDKF